MTDRPILFNDAMVRAILAGTKTQTRRPVKPLKGACAACMARGVPHNADALTESNGDVNLAGQLFGTDPYLRVPYCEHNGWTGGRIRCPLANVGDRLWVRECWNKEGGATSYRADGDWIADYNATKPVRTIRWRPSIHMPRWASRLTLLVTDVRVERLRDITEADARAEGIVQSERTGGWLPGNCATPAIAFGELWRNTYGDEACEADPWVWAVSFEVYDD